MNINVRGALGTQIIELFTGFSNIIEAKTTPSKIIINTGGNPYHTVQRDYLSELFDTWVPIETNSQSMNKTGIDGTNLEKILRHRAHIINIYTQFRIPKFQYADVVVHVRKGDKQLISDSKYIETVATLLETHPNLFVMGDDFLLISDICNKTGARFIHQKPVMDWFTVANAREVFAGVSAFPLSGMVMNPDLKINFFSEKSGYYDGPVKLHHMQGYMDIYKTFVMRHNNLRWV